MYQISQDEMRLDDEKKPINNGDWTIEVDEYDFNDLLPKTLITYLIFLLAVLKNTLSFPTPFSLRYNLKH